MTRKKAIDFNTLFADSNTIPDDFKITLPNGAEVTMGDLREYDSQRGGELTAEIKRQQLQLAEEKAQLQKASERVASTYVQLEAEKAKLATMGGGQAGGGNAGGGSSADPLAAYESDAVFSPVVKHMRNTYSTLENKLSATEKKLDEIMRSVATMGTTYIGDKAARDFAAIMSTEDPVRPKDLSLDNLYKLAVERRIYDRNNLPDLQRTYDELTRDSRHKHELAEAEKRGREARDRELAENAMLPMPGVGGFQPQRQSADMPKNLNDAFSKAGQDREMWKEVNTSVLMSGGAIQ